jgi:toxin CcdB
MARFDVYPNPTVSERRHTPYLLDVQNDHLQGLDSRVVIPLRTRQAMPRLSEVLNPLVEIEGRQVVVDTASLAPVPALMLRQPVLKATGLGLELADALDTLFGSH